MRATALPPSFLFPVFIVLLAFACPSHADETLSRTGQFNTSAMAHQAVAVSLEFNATSRPYSVIATTTINHLRFNSSEDASAAQLRFVHELSHPVGDKNEEGFAGPTHTVLPAAANTSLPRTFVDSFGPCELTSTFGRPLDARAVFSANQVIQVNATVRVELIDVVSVVVGSNKEAVRIPSARTQYFVIDLPDSVSDVVVMIDSSDNHTKVSSVFASLTIGCGADARTVTLERKAHNVSAAIVVPFEKGGRTFVALQMVEGVPLPKEPSFLLSIDTIEGNPDHKDDDFWQPWVIGVIVGGGIGFAGFVLLVIGVIVWKVRSKSHYHRIN